MPYHNNKGRYLIACAILNSNNTSSNLKAIALECVLKYKE